ncbi:MAG TPA: hypothetical protein V6C89_15075 [Drouetiella sp.]
MRTFRASRAAVFACLFCFSQLAANAQDLLGSAKQLYLSGQYQNAETEFLQAIKANPSDNTSYYWYGLCQMKLQSYGSAEAVFNNIMNRERNSALGKMAEEGVAYCRAQLEAQTAAAANQAKLANQNPTNMQKAMDRVQRQGTHAAKRQVKNWNAVADAAQQESDRGAAALDDQASKAAADMASWQIQTSDGGSIPLYSKGQIRAVVKTYTDQRDGLVAAEAQSKTNAVVQGKRSAATIAEDVDHLQQQLQGNEEPAGLKLVPDGTNLYTRNYAPTKPTVEPKTPDEMKATEERLVLSPHTIPGKTITKASQPGKDPQLEVKGVVTHPEP